MYIYIHFFIYSSWYLFAKYLSVHLSIFCLVISSHAHVHLPVRVREESESDPRPPESLMPSFPPGTRWCRSRASGGSAGSWWCATSAWRTRASTGARWPRSRPWCSPSHSTSQVRPRPGKAAHVEAARNTSAATGGTACRRAALGRRLLIKWQCYATYHQLRG